MDLALAVGLAAVAVVLGIVLLLAFVLVGAFLPELMLVLVGIVAIVAVVAIALIVLAFKNDSPNFIVKATKDTEEMQSLLEVGFEYVCQKDGLMFFRRRK